MQSQQTSQPGSLFLSVLDHVTWWTITLWAAPVVVAYLWWNLGQPPKPTGVEIADAADDFVRSLPVTPRD